MRTEIYEKKYIVRKKHVVKKKYVNKKEYTIQKKPLSSLRTEVYRKKDF